MARLLSIVAVGAASIGASACTGSEDATTASSSSVPTPSSTSTPASVKLDDFRDQAQAICADVSSELRAVAPRDGATPADAATALTFMVNANRDGVDRLRMVETPRQFEEAFGSWLDLVEETAKYLEVGSLALRAGDEAAFAQALRGAEVAGGRASASAQDLELPGCTFSG